MPAVFLVRCPQCGREWEAVKAIYDLGPQMEMKCPYCLVRFPRSDAQVLSANFPVDVSGPTSSKA